MIIIIIIIIIITQLLLANHYVVFVHCIYCLCLKEKLLVVLNFYIPNHIDLLRPESKTCSPSKCCMQSHDFHLAIALCHPVDPIGPFFVCVIVILYLCHPVGPIGPTFDCQ